MHAQPYKEKRSDYSSRPSLKRRSAEDWSGRGPNATADHASLVLLESGRQRGSMDTSNCIRILLGLDYPVLRQGLALLLDNQVDMTVVDVASNGNEAVTLFRRHQPDVALLDLRMPCNNGQEAIAAIRTEYPKARIILLTTYDGDEDIYQGLQAGAMAYLLKDTPCNELLESIRTVNAGDKYIPAYVGAKLAQRVLQPKLSDREREVLRLMAAGKSNQEIGTTLGIASGTVKFHVNNILSKLKVKDRTQAVITALQRGIACL